MRTGKQQLIAAGFAFFRATRLHHLLAPLTRGQGAILMLHHVRPWQPRAFAPNRLLEIEPAFLDAALTRIKALGLDVVTMDEALERLGKIGARPFVTLTFDDGYADNRDHALPVLERHDAPFTLYVTTGFADRTARLWWVELEEAIAALDRIDATIGGELFTHPAAGPAEKQAAFAALYWRLREEPESVLLDVVGQLLSQAGLLSAAIAARLCLDWAGLKALSDHPLCTIGVHTLTHPRLAKHPDSFARHELDESRRVIEAHVGHPARHLAYPVGDPTSAGARDFALAQELGFASAVTTRPGILFPEHRLHACALPRLSINGNWQNLDSLEVLLSGVPFAFWNKGRHLNVA